MDLQSWVALATVASGLASIVAVIISTATWWHQGRSAKMSAELALLDRRLEVIEQARAALGRFFAEPTAIHDVIEEFSRLALLSEYLFRAGPTGALQRLINTMNSVAFLVDAERYGPDTWPPAPVRKSVLQHAGQFYEEVNAQMDSLGRGLPKGRKPVRLPPHSPPRKKS